MVIAVLIQGTLVDLAPAALLMSVSSFIFGSSPESTHGGVLLLVAYAPFVVGCVALPISRFIFNRHEKTGLDLLLAWLPPAGALLALAIPASY